MPVKLWAKPILLTNFEQNIMIKNIEFKFVSNNFQKHLTNNIKAINCSDKVFIDKSQDIYKRPIHKIHETAQ